ncbi:leucine carboxyl methyltransferase [Paraperlucidibaca baekdonensis]|uniref:Leucine carboxyl methyltransferase n=1 Tax=Paraperlucidibaca baekdonensis TaxID=748120 RepID=A0A3E0H9F7_9GAMM|nr:class I SAM-dependent methyltransferase [Paraperlucidibaca baekdonensis]REH40309.1 leucine carboxyl methyltransferase [Paraperlucidibaca baekdonensis]
MDTNKEGVAVSALYTAGVWQWAGLTNAEWVTPASAAGVFGWVNAYMRFYRWLNPASYCLRHQLLHRHAAIDYVLTQAKCLHVLEVAAGFSPRGMTFSANPACHYTEMDLPSMVAHKRLQLQRSAAGETVLARPNFTLQAGDITTHDFSRDASHQPTAILTEGLMMYFSRSQQLPLWRAIAQRLAHSDGVYIFDYIPLSEEPRRSLLGRVLHHLRVHWFGIVGDFAYDDRDRQAIASDLRLCGFDEVRSYATGEVAQAWQLPAAEVATRTLIYVCRMKNSAVAIPALANPEAT